MIQITKEFSENLLTYDTYIIAFSGGKDSLASLLYLLDLGIDKNKIELWHHNVDDPEEHFIDWLITPSYVEALGKYFGIKVYHSWKQGGFLKEMLRENSLTQPTCFETPEGLKITGGVSGKPGIRLKFPQVAADLKVRWCSAYLKIDICSTAIRNQTRFNNSRTLVISGERGEESPNRQKYLDFEPDRSDLRDGKVKRHVDRWRAIKSWKEQHVWYIIGRYKIRVHPAYYMGWGRMSCLWCIFGNENQMASAFKVDPKGGLRIANYEKEFGVTIKRNISLKELIYKGAPYPTITDELSALANSTNYSLEIYMPNWVLPSGAYGESCGPT